MAKKLKYYKNCRLTLEWKCKDGSDGSFESDPGTVYIVACMLDERADTVSWEVIDEDGGLGIEARAMTMAEIHSLSDQQDNYWKEATDDALGRSV